MITKIVALCAVLIAVHGAEPQGAESQTVVKRDYGPHVPIHYPILDNHIQVVPVRGPILKALHRGPYDDNHYGTLNHIGEHRPHHYDSYAGSFPAYEFSYSVADPHTGDYKAQKEMRHGDVVKGEYSLVEPDGNVRTVKYHADDKSGFNAVVSHSSPTHHVHHAQYHGPGYGGIHHEPVVAVKPVVAIKPVVAVKPVVALKPVIVHKPVLTSGHYLPYNFPYYGQYYGGYYNNYYNQLGYGYNPGYGYNYPGYGYINQGYDHRGYDHRGYGDYGYSGLGYGHH